MKNFQITILLALLLLVKYSNSQTPVGLHYDINGKAMNGFFDPLTYSPKNKLSKVHYSASYEVGHYYNANGKKIEGLIKFENKKIFFKEKGSYRRTKLTPDLVKNFVIGVDSFFVVSNYYLRGKLQTKPQFVQYITEFEGKKFAKHYHFNSTFALQLPDSKSIKETFMIKEKDKMLWDNFPDNRKFEEKALQYFGHLPYIKKQILSGKIKAESMISAIKYAEYEYKHKNSEPILYDQYWQETRNINNAIYHANITNIQDSIWTIDYYQDSVKLYTINYSSFYPNVKDGEFKAFYPDGIKRKCIRYKNNKIKQVKSYNTLGQLTDSYQYYKTKRDTFSPYVTTIKYDSIVDSNNNTIPLLDSCKTIIRSDKYRDLEYIQVYKDKKLEASYRIHKGDTIYQITNPNFKFKTKTLQKNLEYFLSNKNYEEALSVNAQGIILASIIINKKGRMVDCKLLNSIHPQIDSMVREFLLGENATSLNIENFRANQRVFNKFKVYKYNKTKQFCEFVLPFDFSIVRFYRQPFNYNHFFNHMNHFHQLNSGPKFTPPPPLRFSP